MNLNKLYVKFPFRNLKDMFTLEYLFVPAPVCVDCDDAE